MRKSLMFLGLVVVVSALSVGCGSASSCWTRSGSRVPTQTYSAPAATSAPIVMPAQTIYASSCDPCAAVSSSCDACSPCGTSGSSSYPGAILPGNQ